jgi:hypothetical protein
MNTEANAGGQEIGAEVSPGTTKSGSIDLNDFKVPTGGILKILDDAFGKKLPILQGQLTDFDREGELLGTISSDLAKRFLTASVQFAIAATSTDDKLSIVSAYSAACSRILGYLGWRKLALRQQFGKDRQTRGPAGFLMESGYSPRMMLLISLNREMATALSSSGMQVKSARSILKLAPFQLTSRMAVSAR